MFAGASFPTVIGSCWQSALQLWRLDWFESSRWNRIKKTSKQRVGRWGFGLVSTHIMLLILHTLRLPGTFRYF